MKKRKYVLKLRIKIAIALLVIGYFLFIFVEQEIKMHEQRSEFDRLTQEIKVVEQQNSEIERMIEYTESLEFIERAAREWFGWAKEGEIIFIEKEIESR